MSSITVDSILAMCSDTVARASPNSSAKSEIRVLLGISKYPLSYANFANFICFEDSVPLSLPRDVCMLRALTRSGFAIKRARPEMRRNFNFGP
jgi:hypothetical protein